VGMTASSPVEDKARPRARSDTSASRTRLVQRGVTTGTSLAEPHIEQRLGEHVGSLGAAATQVGKALVGARLGVRLGGRRRCGFRAHCVENAGTEVLMGRGWAVPLDLGRAV
jgi:hypothetical protein